MQGQIKVLPLRTAEEILARERERKARTTLLMALPEDHLAKFHKMTNAKEMWEAIRSRFGGNDESKKMQKYILKQQFKGFSVSNLEGLHKCHDRFQSLPSQLEIHGAGVDSLSFDDLYNNLKVFENDVKGSTASSSSTQNVAFVSENTSSTNNVSTAYGVSNPSGHFARGMQNQGESMREEERCWNSGNKDGRRFFHSEEEEDYALMACNSSGSDTEMSANDKFRLGYGDYRYDGILSYENEVLQSVFMNKEGDLENPAYCMIGLSNRPLQNKGMLISRCSGND
ncbi:hypothetical protein Tco_0256424 [Tanacetum coccineum]